MQAYREATIRPCKMKLFVQFHYCHEKNIFLFFEHDAGVELGSLKKTDRGIRLNEKLSLFEL